MIRESLAPPFFHDTSSRQASDSRKSSLTQSGEVRTPISATDKRATSPFLSFVPFEHGPLHVPMPDGRLWEMRVPANAPKQPFLHMVPVNRPVGPVDERPRNYLPICTGAKSKREADPEYYDSTMYASDLPTNSTPCISRIPKRRQTNAGTNQSPLRTQDTVHQSGQGCPRQGSFISPRPICSFLTDAPSML